MKHAILVLMMLAFSTPSFVLSEDHSKAGKPFNAYLAILEQRGIVEKANSRRGSSGLGRVSATAQAAGKELTNLRASVSDLEVGLGNETGTNTWYGEDAGNAGGGSYNSYFGQNSGFNNTGNSNSFFGNTSGFSNTTGTGNTFVGDYSGAGNTVGSGNVFVGSSAGAASDASGNTYVGAESGFSNTTGEYLAFFGYQAGYTNTAGTDNTFLGYQAGFSTTESYNVFVGSRSGDENTTGSFNNFFGADAGDHNTEGYDNSFFGDWAGLSNTTGYENSFFGSGTGASNTTEYGNSLFGAYSDTSPGITNATAIGYCSSVTQSNSLVLGGVNGQNCAEAETMVGIGVTNPDRQLTVEGTQAIGRFRRYYGNEEAFTRTFAPAFLFERARPTQASPTDIQGGDYLGKVQFRGLVGGAPREYGAMAFIAGDTSQNGRFAFLDRDLTTERVSILNTGNVGIGTTAPEERLHVIGNIRLTGDITSSALDHEVPDYVFEPDYALMQFDELEKFIAREKHLPNIPSAAEIKDKGLNLSEFQMKLLEKIEELTLYTMQQAKTIRKSQAVLERNNSVLEHHKAMLEQKDSSIRLLQSRLALLEETMEKLLNAKR